MFYILILTYCILSALKKDFSFLVVFLLAECFVLFPHPKIAEYEVYIVIFVMWSVICQTLHKEYLNNKCKKITVVSCVIICLLSIAYALDVYLYGDAGIYGTRKTYLYNHLEYIALFAHLLFVTSFINISKSRNGIRDLLSRIRSFSANSYYFNLI